MNIHDRIVNRIDKLIILGEEAITIIDSIRAKPRDRYSHGLTREEIEKAQIPYQFKIGVENLIEQVLDHRNVYARKINELSSRFHDEGLCTLYLGVIKSIQEDIQSGLFQFESI